MIEAETIVVGGGPAGAATACGLASRGREVILIERSSAPHHKVCGEFLSIDTQSHLNRLGVDPVALGAVPIESVTIYSAARAVTAPLPFRALSLSRYRLDEALLKAAQSCGAQLLRNASVQIVAPTASGWKVRCGDGETLRCRNLVLATGKWGVRGLVDTRDTSLVGLKIHLRVTPQVWRSLAGRVELGLMDCGYIGLELVEDEAANLCVLLPRSVAAHVRTSWLAMQDHLARVLPPIAQRFVGAEPLWDKAIAVVCPIGGHLHARDSARLYRVGDRLAHIPPFTGDGIGIALASAALAVEHICRGLPASSYLASARGLTSNAIWLATLLSEIATNDMGRALLIGAARHVPALISSVARRTRLTPTVEAHGFRVTG